MSQFDVYALPHNDLLVVDVQTDLLGDLNSTVVIPLQLSTHKGTLNNVLAPVINILGKPYQLMTTDISSIPRRLLGKPCATLSPDRLTVLKSIDFLTHGF